MEPSSAKSRNGPIAELPPFPFAHRASGRRVAGCSGTQVNLVKGPNPSDFQFRIQQLDVKNALIPCNQMLVVLKKLRALLSYLDIHQIFRLPGGPRVKCIHFRQRKRG